MPPTSSPSDKKAENGRAGGPHPSYIQIARQYISENTLQESIQATGVIESREDQIRLQGVQWIDNVRRALRLPVRTFDTAVIYFHRFRLVHSDLEYSYPDAAAAALFTACKIEDTLKRSKEILCAAWNMKLPSSEQLTQDDPVFEDHSKRIVGLERLMLESSAFDYRSRCPQRLILKVAKYYRVPRDVGRTAYSMSLDLYRTFAPLKQTSSALAIACVELAARLLREEVPDFEAGRDFKRWQTSRVEVMETILDLLDLYTQHRSSTTIGQAHSLDAFIDIRIRLNQESSSFKLPRYTGDKPTSSKPLTNGTRTSNGLKIEKVKQSPISPREPFPADGKPETPGSGSVASSGRGRAGYREGTVRFMLNGQRAVEERKAVDEYLKVEEEEIEVEVPVRAR